MLQVYILRETDEIETFRHIYTQMGVWDRILWKGYIHPLNASIRLLINNNTIYTLKLVTENISVVVGLSRNASVGATVRNMVKGTESKFSQPRKSCAHL